MGDGIQPTDWDPDDLELLAAVPFAVYAVEGLPAEVSGWGGGDREPLESVSLRHELDHGHIEVDSSVAGEEFDPPDAIRDAIEELTDGLVAASSETRTFRVDGIEVPFAFSAAGDRWVAIGVAGDVTVTLSARGIGALALRLRAVTDVAPLLNGGLPEYRASRRELDALDPQRIVELVGGTPLEDVGAALAGLARGGLALLPSERPQPTWIGGEPALPADGSWPEGVHGPMAFVAHVSLADLDPDVWTGPTSGQLHLFCDIEPESRSIEGAGACKILHTPAGAELSVRRFPSRLHENVRIPQQFVTPRIGLSLPDEDAAPMRALGFGFDNHRQADNEYLWKLRAHVQAEQGWRRPVGQLLGWPTWQNDDGTEYLASLRDEPELEWALLLHTDAIDAELYVMLPAADLADGRFDRAEATIEHD